MTIKSWIETNFGTDVVPENLDNWGDLEFTKTYFPADRDGSLFVFCGGQCVIGFMLQYNKRAYLAVQPARYRQDGDKRDRLTISFAA